MRGKEEAIKDHRRQALSTQSLFSAMKLFKPSLLCVVGFCTLALAAPPITLPPHLPFLSLPSNTDSRPHAYTLTNLTAPLP